MGFGPPPDASQRDDGAATVIGQGVFHAQRHLGIHRTHEQPGVLQTSQRRREHLGRHPIESATQSTEALRCITQGFDDHHRPFARHDIQQLTARALRGKHVPPSLRTNLINASLCHRAPFKPSPSRIRHESPYQPGRRMRCTDPTPVHTRLDEPVSRARNHGTSTAPAWQDGPDLMKGTIP